MINRIEMKFTLKKETLLNIFYFSFIFILTWIFIKSIISGFAKESWNITEFLINYQGGFVRRGLLGEVLLHLYNYFALNPYFIILGICVLAYVVLATFFLKSFIKKGYTIFILPFVFFLGNPIINDVWVRKDVLLILLLISAIYFVTRKSNWYIILANIFLIFGLLIHESIGFFSLPILLLIIFYKDKVFDAMKQSRIRRIFISIAKLFPAILTFFCTFYYSGSLSISNKIWESWKHVEFPIQSIDNTVIPGAIDGISWSFKRGLSLAIDTLKNFQDGIYAPLAWVLIIILIYFLLTNTDKFNFKILKYQPFKNFNKTNISNILLFQLMTISPLFVLGWDYSRWIFFWVTSSFALIVLISEEKLSAIFPQILTSISTKINKILNLFFSQSKSFLFLILILIGIPTYSWSLIGFVNSSAFVILLKFFSIMIESVKTLI